MQIHWPDRYVPLFGAPAYDVANERPDDIPFEEQLRGLETVVKAGKVRGARAARAARMARDGGGLDAWAEQLTEDEPPASNIHTHTQCTHNARTRLHRAPCGRAQVRYVGVSNETSYGVSEFVHAAKVAGLPRIQTIQNCYHLLQRVSFETDLAETCRCVHSRPLGWRRRRRRWR